MARRDDSNDDVRAEDVKDEGGNVSAAQADDDSTTPPQVRQAEGEVPLPVKEPARVTIEQVIAAEPSAQQAYMDGWTTTPPDETGQEATTVNNQGVDTSSFDEADGVAGIKEVLAEKSDSPSDAVVPRGVPQPTIPLYHAQAALSALNDRVAGSPTGDEVAHRERREAAARANAEAPPAADDTV